MPENEEIHAYEFQKRPYFFTISCLYFPKKPGRNGNKSPEFRIPGLFHPQKAHFFIRQPYSNPTINLLVFSRSEKQKN